MTVAGCTHTSAALIIIQRHSQRRTACTHTTAVRHTHMRYTLCIRIPTYTASWARVQRRPTRAGIRAKPRDTRRPAPVDLHRRTTMTRVVAFVVMRDTAMRTESCEHIQWTRRVTAATARICMHRTYRAARRCYRPRCLRMYRRTRRSGARRVRDAGRTMSLTTTMGRAASPGSMRRGGKSGRRTIRVCGGFEKGKNPCVCLYFDSRCALSTIAYGILCIRVR
jgi:hypothetical protein